MEPSQASSFESLYREFRQIEKKENRSNEDRCKLSDLASSLIHSFNELTPENLKELSFLAKGKKFQKLREISTQSLIKINDKGGLYVAKAERIQTIARLNALDSNGMNAMHRAAEHGDVKEIRRLLEAGADADEKDSQGRTAANIAKQHGRVEALELLYTHSDIKFDSLPVTAVMQCMEEYRKAISSGPLKFTLKRTEAEVLETYTTNEESYKSYVNTDRNEVVGGLAWWMNASAIQSDVQNKFAMLRDKGLLMTESEFAQKEDPSKFRTPGDAKRAHDLSRIWGAEYLEKAFLEHRKNNYHVPRFIVVIKDDIDVFPVRIDGAYGILQIHQVDAAFGRLVVENVTDAVDVSRSDEHLWTKQIGYDDFSEGNILQQGSDYYIVDTEYRSLHLTTELRSLEEQSMRRYAKNRFEAFYGTSSFDVSVKLDH